jgi:uncharacterized membrane-anchored protein
MYGIALDSLPMGPERTETEVIYVRIPVPDMARLRRHAAAVDVPVARLVRIIVHTSLSKAEAEGSFVLTEGGLIV